MINENIKRARKKRGVSQEEMAAELNVVRQTVSKWETGRSVPNAEMLVQIADFLNVPVNQLLGTETDAESNHSLTDELERLKAELAEQNRREAVLRQANKKRGAVILLSFAAAIAALTVKNELFAILMMFACMTASLVILYRNLSLLTAVSTNNLKLRALRLTTLFDLGVLIITVTVAVLERTDSIELSSTEEKWIAACTAGIIMLFGGYISPRLPFNRHTGLRLPWTIQDEETWNVAHGILGYISVPCVLLLLTANMTVSEAETASVVIVLLWIAVPSILSLAFYIKKFRSD